MKNLGAALGISSKEQLTVCPLSLSQWHEADLLVESQAELCLISTCSCIFFINAFI